MRQKVYKKAREMLEGRYHFITTCIGIFIRAIDNRSEACQSIVLEALKDERVSRDEILVSYLNEFSYTDCCGGRRRSTKYLQFLIRGYEEVTK